MTLRDAPTRRDNGLDVAPVDGGEPALRGVLLDNFEAIGPGWRALLARDSAATFFSSPEWLSSWWELNRGDRRLVLVAVFDAERLVAVAPFMSHRERGVAVVQFVGTGVSDYGSIVVDDAVSRHDAVAAVLDRVRAALPHAVFDLREVSERDPLSAILADWAAARGQSIRTFVTSTCPYIQLAPDLAGHDDALGGSVKRNERRNLRRLDKLGVIDVSADLADGRDIEALMDEFAQVESSHPRADERDNPWTAEKRTFVRTLMRACAGTGQVWLQGVRVDSQLIAYSVAFRQGQTIYGYLQGFHGDYAQYGPGRLLHLHIRRLAISRGVFRFDLLRGAEPYKLGWTDLQCTNRRMLLWPRRVAPLPRLRVLAVVLRACARDDLRRVPFLRWLKYHVTRHRAPTTAAPTTESEQT